MTRRRRRTSSEGLRVYMLFALAEVLCVFLPVIVHAIVMLLMVPVGHKGVFDSPDLLYAAMVLSGIAACKYLVADFLTHHPNVQRSRVFLRVLVAAVHALVSVFVLGLFFHHEHHGGSWIAVEILLVMAGVVIFLIASSDYYGLTHADPQSPSST